MNKKTQLNLAYELCKECISGRICFIRKIGRNTFQAVEHKKDKREKIIYSFELIDDKINVLNTMELEI